MTREEILNKINAIAKKDTKWIAEAEFRIKNYKAKKAEAEVYFKNKKK
jgi:hypothetical protein